MQTIGLLGGMSWESTVTYYQIINQAVKERLGGLHSARCILYSVEFDEIERCQSSGDWARSGEILAQAAQALERAGADFILICTNTMHKVYDQVQAAVSIPILHIADLTLAALRAQGIRRVALLGTAYTMEQDFYKRRLTEGGLEVLIPGESDRREINRVIFQELCRGILSPDSRALLLQLLQVEVDRGRGFEAHSLADLPDGRGVAVLLDKLDNDLVDPPLHIGFSSHSRTSAVFASIPQFS